MDLKFVDASALPERVLNSAEGAKIKDSLVAIKQRLGENLETCTLFPNAGHVDYGTGEVLNGVIYSFRKGTPMNDILPFVGPLNQSLTVYNLGQVEQSKIDECKEKHWKDIVDPPSAKGSGLPGRGENVHDKIDFISAYRKGEQDSATHWQNSMGSHYQAHAIIAKNNMGENKLLFAGGHQSLDNSVRKMISSQSSINIEDLADNDHCSLTPCSATPNLRVAKQLQVINQNQMAGKIMNALGVSSFAEENLTGFSSPVNASYRAFYNTVQEDNRDCKKYQTYSLSQGVLDTILDVKTDNATKNMKTMYMVETPLNFHQICVYKELSNGVRFFPLTTGHSELADFGTKKAERDRLADSVHYTGVSCLHNMRNLSFQPYDPTFKLSASSLFGSKGYAVVGSDQSFTGDIATVSGRDPRNVSVQDFIKCTSHLSPEAIVNAPVSSDSVKLIVDTFPHVLDTLSDATKAANVTENPQNSVDLDLTRVLKKDPQSAHYMQFPVKALRIADKLQKVAVENDVIPMGMQKKNF